MTARKGLHAIGQRPTETKEQKKERQSPGKNGTHQEESKLRVVQIIAVKNVIRQTYIGEPTRPRHYQAEEKDEREDLKRRSWGQRGRDQPDNQKRAYQDRSAAEKRQRA